MNKITLLLILATFANVSYASFPVIKTQKIEIVEIITLNSIEVPTNAWLNIYGWSSLFLFILALVFVLTIFAGMVTLGHIGAGSGPTIANYIAYAIYSTIAAIVLGIISFVKK